MGRSALGASHLQVRWAFAEAHEVIEQLDLTVGSIYKTDRRAGHMDILRELTDGSVGSDPPD